MFNISHLDYIVLSIEGESASCIECWRGLVSLIRDRILTGAHPVVAFLPLSPGPLSPSPLSPSPQSPGPLSPGPRGRATSERREAPGPSFRRFRKGVVELCNELRLQPSAQVEQHLHCLERLVEKGARSHSTMASPRWTARVLAQEEYLASRIAHAYLSDQGLQVRWLDAKRLVRARRGRVGEGAGHYLGARCAQIPEGARTRRLREGSSELTVTQARVASNLAGETVLTDHREQLGIGTVLGASRTERWLGHSLERAPVPVPPSGGYSQLPSRPL